MYKIMGQIDVLQKVVGNFNYSPHEHRLQIQLLKRYFDKTKGAQRKSLNIKQQSPEPDQGSTEVCPGLQIGLMESKLRGGGSQPAGICI